MALVIRHYRSTSSVYSMLQLLHVLQRSTRMPRPKSFVWIGLWGIFNNIKSRSDIEVKKDPAPSGKYMLASRQCVR